jgi:sporulation protein YlmC with PRC-barrel domain
MKTHNGLLTAAAMACAALVVTNPAVLAQNADSDGRQTRQPSGEGLSTAARQGATNSPAELERQMLRASQILGKEVKNAKGDRLGQITDLIIDFETGEVPCAVLSYGGTVGFGESRVAVPSSKLKWSADGDELMLAATKAELDGASDTLSGGWLSLGNREDWADEIDRFYGEPDERDRMERQPLTTPKAREEVRSRERPGGNEPR